MCQFISWIEYEDEVLFLDDTKLSTRDGRKLLKPEFVADLKGHGAIRHYYPELKGRGVDRECSDFSTPNNFPKEIVNRINKGQMSRIGVCPKILTPSVRKKYDKIIQVASKKYNKLEQAAWKEYDKIRQAAWKEYYNRKEYDKIDQAAWKEYYKLEQAASKKYYKLDQIAWKEYDKIRQATSKEYDKIRQATSKEYDKIQQAAWKEYYKLEQAALKECNKIIQVAFWKLAKVKKNRVKAWK